MLKERFNYAYKPHTECNFTFIIKVFKLIKITTSILFLFLFSFTSIQSQEMRDEGFRSPLDIPLYLAGNFGELRSNHFHTGIDIKTQGAEGKAVYSIYEGYISRIKISTGGYGKAIYITHPNGYTSVYAHLKKGSSRIEEYIQNKQYQKESFTIEIFPKKGELQIEKDELIAYSGNTGSSGGPHLHFEIRETASEEPVNPLLFGFKIQDNIHPIIKGIRIYEMDEKSYVSPYPGSAIGFPVEGKYGKYNLIGNQQIEVHGRVGLAIHTYDLLNGYPNKCGIYRIELKVDSELAFSQEFEKLNFSHLRYINTYMDYELYNDGRKYYHKQFVGDNNRLKIYPEKIENGILSFNDDKVHTIDYIVYDSYGNTSKISFQIKSLVSVPIPLRREQENNSTIHFSIKGPNFYDDENISIDIPPMALYDKMAFSTSTAKKAKGTIGPVYIIGDENIPLQKNFTLSIKNPSIPVGFKDKTLFVIVDENDNLSAMGGEYFNGEMKLKSRYFGKYSLAIDTIAPKIKTVNISANKDMSTYNTFSLKISDELSGIDKYRGTIDGQWILMEYDAKTESLTYRFDNNRIAKGKHHFSLFVSDEMGNESRYEVDFIR